MLCVMPLCPAVLFDANSYRNVCVALRQEHDKEVAISQQLMVRTRPQNLVVESNL